MIVYLFHRKVMALKLMEEGPGKHIDQALVSTTNDITTHISYFIDPTQLYCNTRLFKP